MSDPFDVVVLGGGPAGCIAAIGLTRQGYRVALVGAPRSFGAVEGLSARVLEALGGAGCEEALRLAGAPVQREASWNGATVRANREWVVARPAFDAALRRDAAAAGVPVREAAVRRALREAGTWRLETAAGPVRGRFLIEARGRRAPGPRRRGPGATALVQAWTGVRPEPGTAVAPWPGGWVWLATTGDGCASVQVVVADADLPSKAGFGALIGRTVGNLPEVRRWLEGGHPVGPVTARHAGTSRAAQPIADDAIRIGDAALALDPLAGHGVFEAIASATAAVPVVSTLLARPHDGALARAFYEERVRLAFERFARIGRDFYRQERRWPDQPFWRARGTWPDDLPAHAPDPSVVSHVAARPVVEDGFIVRREVVVTADQPRGVFQVAGVPVAELLAWCRRAGDDAQAAAAALDRPPEAVRTAIAWLRHRRLTG